jgi:hypothetical protein
VPFGAFMMKTLGAAGPQVEPIECIAKNLWDPPIAQAELELSTPPHFFPRCFHDPSCHDFAIFHLPMNLSRVGATCARQCPLSFASWYAPVFQLSLCADICPVDRSSRSRNAVLRHPVGHRLERCQLKTARSPLRVPPARDSPPTPEPSGAWKLQAVSSRRVRRARSPSLLPKRAGLGWPPGRIRQSPEIASSLSGFISKVESVTRTCAIDSTKQKPSLRRAVEGPNCCCVRF